MIINDTSGNKQGLYQDAIDLVSMTSTSFPIEKFIRSANFAMDKVTSLILAADGTWRWNDTNYTTLPIGTTDIVSAQVDYSFDTDYLAIVQVDAKDQNGSWIKLKPIDYTEYERPFDNMFGAGAPTYYDKEGKSIFLYPTPNYASADGLRVHFQKKGEYFAIGDTIKEPGFANHLHRYISLFAAYDFAFIKGLENTQNIYNEMIRMEDAIKAFYSLREKDVKIGLRPLIENNR